MTIDWPCWQTALGNSIFALCQLVPIGSMEKNVLGAKKASVLRECEERLAASKEKDKKDTIHSFLPGIVCPGKGN